MFPLFNCAMPIERLEVLHEPLAAGQLASGIATGLLEQKFDAAYPGSHAVLFGDMTNALAICLKVAGVQRGDEVLAMSFNCLSSNLPIAMIDARVVWVDVDPFTGSFDLDDARKKLSSRTRAVVVYHLSGYVCKIDLIEDFCRDHGLILIEDANNAFGATYRGKSVGQYGSFSLFSFYANRQVNGVDGAVILARSSEDAERMRRLRRFGIDQKTFRDGRGEINKSSNIYEVGHCSVMDNLRAHLANESFDDALFRVSLSRRNAELLKSMVCHPELEFVESNPGAHPSFWTCLARSSRRDALLAELKSQGVLASKLHLPNHYYSIFNSTSLSLPGTMELEDTLIALPCGWWFDEAKIYKIGSIILQALKKIS